MENETLTGIRTLAVFLGVSSIVLCLSIAAAYLTSLRRIPMLLVSLSFAAKDAILVYAAWRWGRWDSMIYWAELSQWVVGDMGLVLYAYFAPPRSSHSDPEETPDEILYS